MKYKLKKNLIIKYLIRKKKLILLKQKLEILIIDYCLLMNFNFLIFVLNIFSLIIFKYSFIKIEKPFNLYNKFLNSN